MNFAWLKHMSFCVILDPQGEGGKELRKQYSGLNHKQKQYKPTVYYHWQIPSTQITQ